MKNMASVKITPATDIKTDMGDDHTNPPVAASARDYWELFKPRVMSLVVFSAFAGLYMAPSDMLGTMHPYVIFIAILSIAVGAGASGALNMWYDRDIDAIMERTKDRPLPRGVIPAGDALFFAVLLTIMSISLLGLATNWVAAGLLAFASFFYFVIYTVILKRRTSQNIVIGGAAGAFPPMIGWAAVTGTMPFESLLLFAIIFMWTPPHFWALALFRAKDYEQAGVPMMPSTAGEKSTKWQMLLYTISLIPLTLAPYFLGMVGMVYLVGAIVLNALFMISAIQVLRETEGEYKYAKRMFGYSILYLFLIFTVMMADKI